MGGAWFVLPDLPTEPENVYTFTLRLGKWAREA